MSKKFFELSSLLEDKEVGFTINGVNANDWSGKSVSSVGDVNGDGKSDIVIGAPLAGNKVGQVYVVFGNSSYPRTLELSSLDGNNGFTINGISSYAFTSVPPYVDIGWQVSSVGDINGDGKSDIVIGAPYASPGGRNNAGQVYVVFGNESYPKTLELSSLDGKNGFAINGESGGLGYSISSGDINGDGKADVIAGAWNSNRVYVVFGNSNYQKSLKVSDLDGENGFTFSGISGTKAGRAISSGGDFNGDGKIDIVIGANWASPGGRRHAGAAYVVFGKSSYGKILSAADLDGKNGLVINGVGNYDRVGSSLSSAGDLNGDGLDDIIIGGVHLDGESEVYAVFGSSSYSKTLELSDLDGTNGFTFSKVKSSFRTDFSSGDINGDEKSDIIIGDPRDGGSGRVYVVFGRSKYSAVLDLSVLEKTSGFVIRGINSGDDAGFSVSAVDMDSDGREDLVIGASRADTGGKSDVGQTYVVYSSAFFPVTTTTTLTTTPSTTLTTTVTTSGTSSLSSSGTTTPTSTLTVTPSSTMTTTVTTSGTSSLSSSGTTTPTSTLTTTPDITDAVSEITTSFFEENTSTSETTISYTSILDVRDQTTQKNLITEDTGEGDGGSSSGLSTGDIADIIIGVGVLLLMVTACSVYYFRKMHSEDRDVTGRNEGSFENPAYEEVQGRDQVATSGDVHQIESGYMTIE